MINISKSINNALGRSEKRRMEKKAKKLGVSVEVLEYGHFSEGNSEKANEIAEKFNSELAEIGWKIDSEIVYSKRGSRLKLGLYPMSFEEYQQFQKEEASRKQNDSKNKH